MQSRLDGIGSHVYSPPPTSNQDQSETNTQNIQTNSTEPLKVTIFTSSPDEVNSQLIGYELFGAPDDNWTEPLFKDQMDWLIFTIEHLLSLDRPVLIDVRIHPRLG